MSKEKQTVYRLYTSGSADIVMDGDVHSVADLTPDMEMHEEVLPNLAAESIAARGLKSEIINRRHTANKSNRRGGRSHNEGSDSEHDPYWNAPREALDDEQLERNRRGREAMRAIVQANREKNKNPSDDE